MPFQRSTMTFDDAPMPMAKRPGAASQMAAVCWASSAGPRVKTGMMAMPSRTSGTHWLASTSGVKPSVPSASELQNSV